MQGGLPHAEKGRRIKSFKGLTIRFCHDQTRTKVLRCRLRGGKQGVGVKGATREAAEALYHHPFRGLPGKGGGPCKLYVKSGLCFIIWSLSALFLICSYDSKGIPCELYRETSPPKRVVFLLLLRLTFFYSPFAPFGFLILPFPWYIPSKIRSINKKHPED